VTLKPQIFPAKILLLISNKDVYSKNYLMHNGIRHIKDYKKRKEKQREN